ncbi:type IV secretory pathway VirB2 component (pilin) [Curtobacterium luteum]|uniref:Type IV secretory pathway VirB2 component (Pilin) n=1 Tax=Curtobacterium luteum TaxID=33881 RepID=A0A8H9L2Q1_9MICO|nr:MULTISPECIES: hypothetical protein [Curtobacterium]MBM7800913.1 type IV secretory pathway VirB2 component (pilin) [Curtobacterium luteum]NUU49511.1 hypothetical protein [Curtobacterium luteum]GGL09721.1 hypothetical protein GCM10009769_29750 [Curtobacterium luteum]
MRRSTGERWIALAAVVAALAPALSGVLQSTIVFVPQTWLVAGSVLGALGAVVVLVAAWLTRARATVTFALATLLSAVSWPVPGIVGSFVALVAIVLLLAFGVQVVRGSSGFRRVLGWVVAVGGVLLVVSHFALSWFAPLAAVSQAALDLVVLAPGVVQAVTYAAAAVLFLPPLLRPVRDAVRTLWSTADVR